MDGVERAAHDPERVPTRPILRPGQGGPGSGARQPVEPAQEVPAMVSVVERPDSSNHPMASGVSAPRSPSPHHPAASRVRAAMSSAATVGRRARARSRTRLVHGVDVDPRGGVRPPHALELDPPRRRTTRRVEQAPAATSPRGSERRLMASPGHLVERRTKSTQAVLLLELRARSVTSPPSPSGGSAVRRSATPGRRGCTRTTRSPDLDLVPGTRAQRREPPLDALLTQPALQPRELVRRRPGRSPSPSAPRNGRSRASRPRRRGPR